MGFRGCTRLGPHDLNLYLSRVSMAILSRF